MARTNKFRPQRTPTSNTGEAVKGRLEEDQLLVQIFKPRPIRAVLGLDGEANPTSFDFFMLGSYFLKLDLDVFL